MVIIQSYPVPGVQYEPEISGVTQDTMWGLDRQGGQHIK